MAHHHAASACPRGGRLVAAREARPRTPLHGEHGAADAGERVAPLVLLTRRVFAERWRQLVFDLQLLLARRPRGRIKAAVAELGGKKASISFGALETLDIQGKADEAFAFCHGQERSDASGDRRRHRRTADGEVGRVQDRGTATYKSPSAPWPARAG